MCWGANKGGGRRQRWSGPPGRRRVVRVGYSHRGPPGRDLALEESPHRGGEHQWRGRGQAVPLQMLLTAIPPWGAAHRRQPLLAPPAFCLRLHLVPRGESKTCRGRRARRAKQEPMAWIFLAAARQRLRGRRVVRDNHKVAPRSRASPGPFRQHWWGPDARANGRSTATTSDAWSYPAVGGRPRRLSFSDPIRECKYCWIDLGGGTSLGIMLPLHRLDHLPVACRAIALDGGRRDRNLR